MDASRLAHGLLPRAVAPALASALDVNPVVVLTGPRQVGKSTLVRPEPRGTGQVFGTRRYITFDDPNVLALAMADPDLVLEQAPDLVIDEVQRVPSLLLDIKRHVDARYPRRLGQFILTGSANLLLMKQVADSLTGRATYVTIWPLTRRESLGFGTAGEWGTYLREPREQWYQIAMDSSGPEDDWKALAKRGGYPSPAYHLGTQAARRQWFDGYLQTYVQRDIPELSNIENIPDFQRLMEAVAVRLGSLQNQSELSRDIGLPQATVHRYLNLLETSYQLVRLAPYSVNRTKRLMKSPKLYWSDTGFGLSLTQGVEPGGAHLENLILHDLLVWREIDETHPNILYWRTDGGYEVDFVIEAAHDTIIPVEIKATTRPRTKDVASMQVFMEEYRDKVKGGLLLYGGNEVFWIARGVLAVPWWKVI